jgi:hypothetical protein
MKCTKRPSIPPLSLDLADQSVHVYKDSFIVTENMNHKIPQYRIHSVHHSLLCLDFQHCWLESLSVAESFDSQACVAGSGCPAFELSFIRLLT